MTKRLVEKQVIYSGRKVRLEVHHLDDERTGHRILQEVCVHNGAVVVLPLLGSPGDETVVLIRNRRYTVGQVLLELPAGTLEKGEDPMNCAGRELLEETGYLAGKIKPLSNFYSSPGILTEKMYSFAAYDLEMRKMALEEDEEIELSPTPFEEAIEMCRDGRIMDGKTIGTLLFYDRFHRTER